MLEQIKRQFCNEALIGESNKSEHFEPQFDSTTGTDNLTI